MKFILPEREKIILFPRQQALQLFETLKRVPAVYRAGAGTRNDGGGIVQHPDLSWTSNSANRRRWSIGKVGEEPPLSFYLASDLE